jgi:hypothetical protein
VLLENTAAAGETFREMLVTGQERFAEYRRLREAARPRRFLLSLAVQPDTVRYKVKVVPVLN